MVEYRNNVLFVDGRRATPEEIALFARTNPYVSLNWSRRPEDRALTPTQQTERDQYEQAISAREAARRDAMSASGGTSFGPVIRSEDMPRPDVLAESSVIPSHKLIYNPNAGASARLNKLAGVATRSGTVRA